MSDNNKKIVLVLVLAVMSRADQIGCQYYVPRLQLYSQPKNNRASSSLAGSKLYCLIQKHMCANNLPKDVT